MNDRLPTMFLSRLALALGAAALLAACADDDPSDGSSADAADTTTGDAAGDVASDAEVDADAADDEVGDTAGVDADVAETDADATDVADTAEDDTTDDVADADADTADADAEDAAADGGGETGDAVSDTEADGETSAPVCACDASATCVVEEDVAICVCPTVTFTKEPFADPEVVRDCIQPNVCIARGDSQSIFNSAVETQAAAGPGSDAPAGTLWTRGSCAGAPLRRFDTFLSDRFANSAPPSVVGVPGCLHLPEYDEFHLIEFTSWSGGGPGGGFAYDRNLVVGDGVACP